ncbi:hypothetical protein J6590_035039 [Homalodisca vitripennis]|nr:hypothetical protein J6590_035039 [Homalodisca vitripennis]
MPELEQVDNYLVGSELLSCRQQYLARRRAQCEAGCAVMTGRIVPSCADRFPERFSSGNTAVSCGGKLCKDERNSIAYFIRIASKCVGTCSDFPLIERLF